MANDSSDLWQTLHLVNEWTRFADAKAGAVLAAGAGVGSLLLTSLGDPQSVLRQSSALGIVLLVSSLVASGGAVVSALICLNPRVDPEDTEWESNLFFGAIAKHESSQAYLDNVRSRGDSRDRDLAHQIRENARIADFKFRWVARATQFVAAMVLLAALAWVLRVLETV